MQASAKVPFLRELTMFRCSRRTPEGADYDLPFVAQRVQIVGPRLHHLSPLRKIFGEVVSRANAVPSPMRKLPSMASLDQPCSFRSVDAMLRKPWTVIWSPA